MPGWYKSGELRGVETLARWMVEMGFGVIVGMPGTMKTTKVMYTPLLLERPVVLSVPLRQLRDELYEKIMFKHTRLKDITRVVKAHDEVCQPLAERVKTRREEPYLKLLAEHVESVKPGKETCLWKDEVERAIDYLRWDGPLLILTTHRVGFMLKLLSWRFRTDALFVFDEGEDLLLKIGEPVNLEELLYIRKISKKVYNRMRGLYKPLVDGFKRGYLLPQLVRDVFVESFFVSATFPPTLKNYLDLYVEQVKKDPEVREVPVYHMRASRVPDKVVIVDKVFAWKTEDEWKGIVYPQVVQIIDAARKKGLAVGIVARRHEQAEALTEMVEALGYKVWSDYREDNRYHFSRCDVVVITTLGKGYRGVNFYTRVNQDANRWDFPVVIGFFQGSYPLPDVVHPLLYGILGVNPLKKDDVVEGSVEDFLKEMLYAKNFQALFRFVRQLDREHLLILVDKRWEEAFTAYAEKYWRNCPKVRVQDERDLYQRVYPLIETLQ